MASQSCKLFFDNHLIIVTLISNILVIFFYICQHKTLNPSNSNCRDVIYGRNFAKFLELLEHLATNFERYYLCFSFWFMINSFLASQAVFRNLWYVKAPLLKAIRLPFDYVFFPRKPKNHILTAQHKQTTSRQYLL